MVPLPSRSSLESFANQARELFDGWNSGEAAAISLIRHHHPRFLDERVSWLARDISEAELRDTALSLSDAQLALARWYSFRDWSSLAEWVQACLPEDSGICHFESAVEAVVGGDVHALQRLLRAHPELVRARSTIVTHHDPPRHRATLLHYVAANGVEGFRQRTPPNAVEIATLLLRSGAEPDALASMYGSQQTTMNMLVSSAHPAAAGVQAALAETLLDFGAAADGPPGTGEWQTPVFTALAFGYLDTARALVRRGARVDNVAVAAGLGQLVLVSRLLPGSDSEARHRAVALAAQHGHTETLRLLLEAGEDPSRYNPSGNHGHSTPLHQAVWSDHAETVRLLVERGARLDARDTIYQGTPLGWAEFGGHAEIADYLRAQPGSA